MVIKRKRKNDKKGKKFVGDTQINLTEKFDEAEGEIHDTSHPDNVRKEGS